MKFRIIVGPLVFGADVLSVMSVKGKKVLHIDRNDHYGGSDSIFVMKLDLINLG